MWINSARRQYEGSKSITCVSRYAYISNIYIYPYNCVYIYICGIVYLVMCICTNSNSFCAHICSTSPSKRTICQRAGVNLNSIHASRAYTDFCSTARGKNTVSTDLQQFSQKFLPDPLKQTFEVQPQQRSTKASRRKNGGIRGAILENQNGINY